MGAEHEKWTDRQRRGQWPRITNCHIHYQAFGAWLGQPDKMLAAIAVGIKQLGSRGPGSFHLHFLVFWEGEAAILLSGRVNLPM